MYAEWGGASAGVVTGIGRWPTGEYDNRQRRDGEGRCVLSGTARKCCGPSGSLHKTLAAGLSRRFGGRLSAVARRSFPDEDDFGRIFRNNAVISAAGMPQFAAIMGNCVAGGGYLPVLCDKLLMTEGSGLYLAGPALVKGAIGQEVSHEELGGAAMQRHQRHDRLSRTRRRSLPRSGARNSPALALATTKRRAHFSLALGRGAPQARLGRPVRDCQRQSRDEYDVHDVMDCLVDGETFAEYKAEYGGTLVCGTARLGGFAVGIVASQRRRVGPPRGPFNLAA